LERFAIHEESAKCKVCQFGANSRYFSALFALQQENSFSLPVSSRRFTAGIARWKEGNWLRCGEEHQLEVLISQIAEL
jgi:hypothetical protein